MFGRTYFGGRYFGPGYFGGGSDTAAPGASAAQIWSYVLPNGLTAGQTAIETHAMLTALTSLLADCPDVLTTVLKLLRNKQITDPMTGRMTVYDDDGVTPLLAGDLFEDAAGSVRYRGRGAEHRGRLT